MVRVGTEAFSVAPGRRLEEPLGQALQVYGEICAVSTASVFRSPVGVKPGRAHNACHCLLPGPGPGVDGGERSAKGLPSQPAKPLAEPVYLVARKGT